MMVIALSIVVAAPPAAAERQADLRTADDALQPNPDGTYFLPLPGMESVTLRFEAGDMPVELVALRISEDGDSLVADLRYTGEKVVTGWQVRTGSVRSDGRETSSAMMGTDWGASGDPRMGPPPGYRILGGPPETEGPIQPGEVRSINIGSASGPHLAELVLSVPVLIFEDASYMGSGRYARQILERRAVDVEETARWLERLDEILASTSGEWQLTRALEELLAEMEELDEVPDGPRRPGAPGIRHTFEINLRSIIDSGRSSKTIWSRRKHVQELVNGERRQLEAMIEHVPDELPRDDAPPGRVPREKIEEGPGGDPSGDGGVDDCDCGGSITYSQSTIDSRNCNGSFQGWSVSETWPYSCRNDAGEKLESGTEHLVGYGACIENQFCFTDTYCPPDFDGPIIEVVDNMRVLTRGVRDRHVEVGLCGFTPSCKESNFTRLMTIQCFCSPMPRPRCYADGCPILIETGAGGFSLTGMADGVTFDLTGHGIPSRVAWTRAGGDDAWLVLDRNGNGRIDDATELFGDRTDQPPSAEPHGFLALAVFDDPAHGGDGDGVISAADSVFSDLRLWLDHDHDGFTDLGELVPLASADIAAIELDFFRAERRDNFGNRFRYSAKVHLASGGHRLATDVFLQFE